MKGTTRHMILKQFFRLLVLTVILLSGTPLRAQGPFENICVRIIPLDFCSIEFIPTPYQCLRLIHLRPHLMDPLQ
jgi:hypothetical protein